MLSCDDISSVGVMSTDDVGQTVGATVTDDVGQTVGATVTDDVCHTIGVTGEMDHTSSVSGTGDLGHTVGVAGDLEDVTGPKVGGDSVTTQSTDGGLQAKNNVRPLSKWHLLGLKRVLSCD